MAHPDPAATALADHHGANNRADQHGDERGHRKQQAETLKIAVATTNRRTRGRDRHARDRREEGDEKGAAQRRFGVGSGRGCFHACTLTSHSPCVTLSDARPPRCSAAPAAAKNQSVILSEVPGGRRWRERSRRTSNYSRAEAVGERRPRITRISESPRNPWSKTSRRRLRPRRIVRGPSTALRKASAPLRMTGVFPPTYPCARCTRVATFSRSAFSAMKPVASFWL